MKGTTEKMTKWELLKFIYLRHQFIKHMTNERGRGKQTKYERKFELYNQYLINKYKLNNPQPYFTKF